MFIHFISAALIRLNYLNIIAGIIPGAFIVAHYIMELNAAVLISGQSFYATY